MRQRESQSVRAIWSHTCSQVGTPVLLAAEVAMAMSVIARTLRERITSGETKLLAFRFGRIVSYPFLQWRFVRPI